MNSDEYADLQRSINQDELALSELQKEESDLLLHISKEGFAAANERKRLQSEMRVIEDHLEKNKKRLNDK